MADDGEDGGFLAMDLNSSDSESGDPPETKLPRDYQSQEDYEAQKASWKPTVEKGEVRSHFRRSRLLALTHPY